MKASTNTGHANARPPARVMMLPLLVACCFLIHCPSMAALVIHLPGIQLLPNTAGQSFDVHLQNSGGPVEVTGMAFNIQVADGGPAAGGSIHGPAITSVNIFTGTVFGPNNNGLSGGGSLVPQVYERGTLTAAGTVSLPSGESKVATVTLDTTGFASGTFLLTLWTLNGPTRYTTLGEDLYPTLIDGSVTVTAVPEPVAWALATGAALLGWTGLRKVSRRRARKAQAWLPIACCGLIPGSMRAALVIDLPEIQLLPHTANQSFAVYLQNTGAPVLVNGIGFNIQVADGGPAAGGNIAGPAITLVDVVTGTVFGPNNNGLSGGGSLVPQVYERGTLTAAGTVSLPSGESRVATVTLDTTGFGSGTFGLTLDTLNGPAKYTTAGTDLFPALIEGSVTIAPPPVITGLAIHNPSRMALTFSSTRGFGYRIQRAQAVADALWTNVPHSLAANDPLTSAALPGSGTTQTLYVEVPVGAGVFYRVSMERSGT